MKEQIPHVQVWVEELDDRGVLPDEETMVKQGRALVRAINARRVAVTQAVADELNQVIAEVEQLFPGSPRRQRLAQQLAYQHARLNAFRQEGGRGKRDTRPRDISAEVNWQDDGWEEARVAPPASAPKASQVFEDAKAAAEAGALKPEHLRSLSAPEYTRLKAAHRDQVEAITGIHEYFGALR